MISPVCAPPRCFACGSCRHEIADSGENRRKLNASGSFVAQNPRAANENVGFHWNAIATMSWGQLAELYLRAKQAARKGDTSLLQQFYQKRLGPPWREYVEDFMDTSVLGGFFDDEWKEPTRKLWLQMEAGKWRFFSSAIAFDELTNAPQNVLDLFLQTFSPDALVAVTPEIEGLATQYIQKAVLSPKYTDDARHVAASTVAKIDFLVSWNVRHLVNVQREAGFNAVNLLHGYQPVRIVNPRELIYGEPD